MEKFPDTSGEKAMTDLDVSARMQKFRAAAAAVVHPFMKEMCLCMEDEHLPLVSEIQ